ncbi:hypothetical protein HAX54_025294 [Datura stramonium]|uniref:Uncharacterized protein n=1 Tax=Datura stramonium TaxID=4076 RepID=A0ABS8S6E9_DATST|nr:hypothetical protein [Datura stramonium]
MSLHHHLHLTPIHHLLEAVTIIPPLQFMVEPTPPIVPTILTPPTTLIIGPETLSIPGYARPQLHLTPPLGDYYPSPPSIPGVYIYASTSGSGQTSTCYKGLWNPRVDGFGKLYREGKTSLLNSMLSQQRVDPSQELENSR